MSINISFYCPITAELMIDPVIDREGNSYERAAIEEWVIRNKTSPITRNPLTFDDLTPNRALKEAISDAKLRGINLPYHMDFPRSQAPVIVAEAAPIVNLEVSCQPARNKLYRGSQSDVEVILHTSIQCAERKNRVPSDIVVVIDVSGSMGKSATAYGVEDSGLCILDIVKHAVRTIINTLKDSDRLALVSFSDVAEVILPLTQMTGIGKTTAEGMLDNMFPGGMTNLWDGLNSSLNILKNRSTDINDDNADAPLKNAAVILLTDGEPNIIPPRGNIAMLKRYASTNGNKYPGIISTFGFGYSLDSALLSQVAQLGNGMYSFIPDTGFVGTAFVNALSNTLVTTAIDARLILDPYPGVKFVADSMVNEFSHEILDSGSIIIHVGTLQCGQPRDFMKRFIISSSFEGSIAKITVEYRANNQIISSSQSMLSTSAIAVSPFRNHSIYDEKNDIRKQLDFDVESFRLSLVSTLSKALDTLSADVNMTLLEQAMIYVSLLIEEMKEWISDNATISPPKSNRRETEVTPQQRVKDMLADLEGQVTEALSRLDWYFRWGSHYIWSLRRSHELQQCNNFKDPGIQHYGGVMFREVRDFSDDAFCNLPPPKPRPSPYGPNAVSRAPAPSIPSPINTIHAANPPVSSSVTATTNSSVLSMASFHSRATPCFDGKCICLMKDGSYKTLDSLKKGDIFYNGTIVQCILKTRCENGKCEFVCFKDSGLLVTPWHPISIDNHWVFPIDIASCASYECDFVYSLLVLHDDGINYASSVVINDIECITLAHGIQNDIVASHPFFGSYQIVEFLKTCEGWENGIVFLDAHQGDTAIRDKSTGLIIKLIETVTGVEIY